MKKVEDLEQYIVREHRYIEDLRSDSYLLTHRKSGARIALLSNDDDNKVFYVGFRTPPTDSTGVAHIVEHTVLCGSDKYPIKDPFLELAKGSLNTFLNAMTYPDKTVYPVADMNDVDFRNLMDVYLDAVFHPNIYKNINIFRQEGWHYESEGKDSPVTLNGVVYNEMKGAYSSPDDVLGRMVMNSLYPDNAYGTESGGDPDCIPDLTYEAYLDFHSRYYHPSNSYIYLYGNMDMVERLEYLDREYLSAYDRIDVDSLPVPQKPFDDVRTISGVYPVNSGDQTEHRTFLTYNVALESDISNKDYLAWNMLDYALCSSPGAPVRKALIDAGIGSEVSSYFEGGLQEPLFSITARDTDPDRVSEFTEIIERELKKAVREGIDRRALTAALNTNEFRYREADFGSYPKGLMYGLQALDSWLYNDDAPFRHIESLEAFRQLRESLDSGYYEELVTKGLLENKHKTILTLSPEAGLIEQKDRELSEKLESFRLSLSEDDRQKLADETRALKAWQQEPDREEDLMKLPVLERADLTREIKPYKNSERKYEDVDVLFHPIWTNGISYMDFCFDITDLPVDRFKYIGLMGIFLSSLDTEERGYGELCDEINILTGGLSSAVLSTVRHVDDGKGGYIIIYEVKVKSFLDRSMDAAKLVAEIISSTKWDSPKRIKELLSETRTDMQARFLQAGHASAVNHAYSQINSLARLTAEMEGVGFYHFVDDLVTHFDERWDQVLKELKATAAMIFTKDRYSFDLIADEDDYEKIIPVCSVVKEVLGDSARGRAGELPKPEYSSDAFRMSSTVQYVGLCGDFRKEGIPYNGALKVLRVIMSYDYLWSNIRVLGGAYGCMCTFTRTGLASFVSYRDPHLKETLEVYNRVVDYIENFNVDERTMTKFVIGAVAELDRPMSPSAYGNYSRRGYVSCFSEEAAQKERDEVLDVTPEKIRDLSKYLKAVLKNSVICVFGGEAEIEKNKELFDRDEYIFRN
ncbi:MAG: insulinase family protein [Lachnospiraceae bacterium]|nr:insulinase family protein [Lachnospiraceae bacterium]